MSAFYKPGKLVDCALCRGAAALLSSDAAYHAEDSRPRVLPPLENRA